MVPVIGTAAAFTLAAYASSGPLDPLAVGAAHAVGVALFAVLATTAVAGAMGGALGGLEAVEQLDGAGSVGRR